MVILRATSILGGQKVDKSMMCSITLVLMKAVPFYKKKRKKKEKKRNNFISYFILFFWENAKDETLILPSSPSFS
jgi:hypothetical protein